VLTVASQYPSDNINTTHLVTETAITTCGGTNGKCPTSTNPYPRQRHYDCVYEGTHRGGKYILVGEVWQITEMAALVPLTSKYSTRNHIYYNKPVKVPLTHMYYRKLLHAGMALMLK